MRVRNNISSNHLSLFLLGSEQRTLQGEYQRSYRNRDKFTSISVLWSTSEIFLNVKHQERTYRESHHLTSTRTSCDPTLKPRNSHRSRSICHRRTYQSCRSSERLHRWFPNRSGGSWWKVCLICSVWFVESEETKVAINWYSSAKKKVSVYLPH